MKSYHILFSVFVLRIVLLYIFPIPYWYDEIIFISFSQQSFSLLLETLLAEPHPPGFFMTLKAFPVDSVVLTRIALACVSFGIVGMSVLYGVKTTIVKTFKLEWGIALYLISYSFYSATAFVRDRSISIPLAMLACFVSLYLFKRKGKHISVAHYALLGVVYVVLLVLSYDVFVLMALAFVLLALYIRTKAVVVLGSILGIGGLVYGWTYGFLQIAGNTDRSIWFSYRYNSLFHSLYKHVAGVLPHDIMTDAAYGIVIVLLGIGIVHGVFRKKERVALGIVVLSVCWIGAAYLLHLLPRAHYVAIIYLPISILAGWGMREIPWRGMRIGLFVVVAVVGFAGYMLDATRTRTLYGQLQQTIQGQIDMRGRVGLLADAPIMPHVLQLEYFTHDDRLVPMHVVRDEHLPVGEIGRMHLETDMSYTPSEMTTDQVQSRLASYDADVILYFSAPFRHTYAVDPKQTARTILLRSCTHVDTIAIMASHSIYVFEDCVVE